MYMVYSCYAVALCSEITKMILSSPHQPQQHNRRPFQARSLQVSFTWCGKMSSVHHRAITSQALKHDAASVFARPAERRQLAPIRGLNCFHRSLDYAGKSHRQHHDISNIWSSGELDLERRRLPHLLPTTASELPAGPDRADNVDLLRACHLTAIRELAIDSIELDRCSAVSVPLQIEVDQRNQYRWLAVRGDALCCHLSRTMPIEVSMGSFTSLLSITL